MLDLMVSPLRAGVLTSDVGVGKTFSAILVIIMVYYMVLDRQKLNLPVDAGACLWITQANLVVQTFREIITHFPEFFRIYVYYGDGQSDLERRPFRMPRNSAKKWPASPHVATIPW